MAHAGTRDSCAASAEDSCSQRCWRGLDIRVFEQEAFERRGRCGILEASVEPHCVPMELWGSCGF